LRKSKEPISRSDGGGDIRLRGERERYSLVIPAGGGSVIENGLFTALSFATLDSTRVPEPSTMAFFGIGLAALLLFERRNAFWHWMGRHGHEEASTMSPTALCRIVSAWDNSTFASLGATPGT
jgi:hypothetical protein